MRKFLPLVLVVAAVAVIGDLLLRQLPEKILAGLNRPAASLCFVARAATPAAPTTPASLAGDFASGGGGTPEEIAEAGRIVTFSTQNLRARLALGELKLPLSR